MVSFQELTIRSDPIRPGVTVVTWGQLEEQAAVMLNGLHPDDAVQVIRAHLGPRYVFEAETIMVGEGMLGRG